MITTMQDFQAKIENKNIEKIIQGIEKAIQEYKDIKIYSWIGAILDNEFSLNDRNEVARRYIKEGGWYAVFHMTSSENGERPGLTGFDLFTSESYEKWNKAYGAEYKNKGHLFFREED